jgi:hypothetical protein
MQSLKQIFIIADSFERNLPVDRRVIGPGSGVKLPEKNTPAKMF